MANLAASSGGVARSKLPHRSDFYRQAATAAR